MALCAPGGCPVLVLGQSVHTVRPSKPGTAFCGLASREIAVTTGGLLDGGACADDGPFGAPLLPTQEVHFRWSPFFHWVLEKCDRSNPCPHKEQVNNLSWFMCSLLWWLASLLFLFCLLHRSWFVPRARFVIWSVGLVPLVAETRDGAWVILYLCRYLLFVRGTVGTRWRP